MKRTNINHIFFIALVLIVIQLVQPAFASDRITQSNDQNINTAGDVTTGTGDALGVGFSFGDVDIGDCVVTKQTSILLVGWQRFDENPWCQAVVMYQMGQIDTAERILCRDTNIGTYYTDEIECRDAINLPPLGEVVSAPEVVDEHLEDEEEYHEELLMEQQQFQVDLETKIAMLEEELQRKEQPVIQKVYVDDGAERRAKARAARDKILEGEK